MRAGWQTLLPGAFACPAGNPPSVATLPPAVPAWVLTEPPTPPQPLLAARDARHPPAPPSPPTVPVARAPPAPRRVRNEGWARLSRPMRYIGLCVKLMPQVLCFFHVLTGVVVFASLSFIQAGVCRNAQNSAGDFTFFQSGANLVYFAVVLWSVASCGGFYRKTCLPDAGLASPQSASDVDPPESKLSFEACWQALCCVWTTFRP